MMQQPLNTDDFAFLIGFPPLTEYLSFMQVEAIDGAAVDRRNLVDQWRAANLIVAGLAPLERGDHSQPLPEELAQLREELTADPIYQHNLFVPADLVMLDLNRVVVLQKRVNLRYSRELQGLLPAAPTSEQVFRFSLMDRDQPPITAARSSQNEFTFTSPSNDFRLLDARLLSNQDRIADFYLGQLTGGVCLAVGYGSNFLSAIAINDLMLLQNGTHRAHALRARGFETAPFLVHRVSSADELALFYPQNTQQVIQTTQIPRPPTLSDFFTDALHIEARVPRRRREVRISFGANQVDLPI
jgi:hypothetical protein